MKDEPKTEERVSSGAAGPDDPPPDDEPPEPPRIGPSLFDWRELLADAHAALRIAVRHVPAGGWELPTPCDEWTVTQVLRHAARSQATFAACLTGSPWPPEEPTAPSGRPAPDPMRITLEAIALSRTAFTLVSDTTVAVPTPLPAGPLPPWLAASACALDAAIHAWDITAATGQPAPLAPETAHALLVVATEIVEPLRPFGAFAPPFDPLAEARARGPAHTGDLPDDDASTLLRYLGRNPAWSP